MTATRIGMVITEASLIRKVGAYLPLILLVTLSASGAYANQPPVADAGPDRYAGSEAIVLDGTGSYDPDPGDTLTYQWGQVSGLSVDLSNTDAATPTLTATLTGSVEIVVLELTVADDLQAISTDTAQVTLVSELPPVDESCLLESEPFDPSKPTFVYFGGGDCWMGGGGIWANDNWNAKTNVISFPWYLPDICESLDCPPQLEARIYYRFGNALIVFLSSMAPTYDQPIETAGYSTGGMPTMDAAIQVNSFRDPRHNVNMMLSFSSCA